MNTKFYLNEDNLLKGHDRTNFKTSTLIKGYTMYSHEYMHGNHITKTVTKEIYSKEVLKKQKQEHIWAYGRSIVFLQSLG